MLDELDRPVAAPRLEAARRPREAFPEVAVDPLEEEHLAARRVDRDACGDDARVVQDDELAVQLPRQVGETPVADRAGRAVVDEEPRGVAPRRRLLRDQLGRQLVVQRSDVHRGPR